MTALRPGVRALRLPVPGVESPYTGTECRVMSMAHTGPIKAGDGRVYICRSCLVVNLDGLADSIFGGRLAWPAAYLLPLWDRDEDNEHTQPADAGEEMKS